MLSATGASIHRDHHVRFHPLVCIAAVVLLGAACSTGLPDEDGGVENVEGLEAPSEDDPPEGPSESDETDPGEAADDLEPLADGSWRELAQDDGSFHPDEWAGAQAACVREQGFAAQGDNAERSVRFEPVPDDQQEAAQEAITSCQQQVQIDPRFNEDPDEQQLEATYDWFVNETIPCLEDEGFEANWDVPSFETFAARWPTAEQWNPWLQLTVPVAEVERAQAACPGIPFDELWE